MNKSLFHVWSLDFRTIVAVEDLASILLLEELNYLFDIEFINCIDDIYE